MHAQVTRACPLALAIREAALTLADALGDLTGARRIPVERATSLLDLATDAGLVNADDSFAAALRSELARSAWRVWLR